MSLSSFFNFFQDYADYAYHPDPTALDPDIRHHFLKGYQEEYLGLTKDSASFSTPLKTYFDTQDEQFQKALARNKRDLTDQEKEQLQRFEDEQARIKRTIELFEEEFEKVGANVHPGDLAARGHDEKKELLDALDALQAEQQDFLDTLGVLTPAPDDTTTIMGSSNGDSDSEEDEEKDDDASTTITGGDSKAVDAGFEQTSKDARAALDESLADSIDTLHDAAALEQNMKSLLLVLVANKRRFNYEQSYLASFASLLSTPHMDPSLPEQENHIRSRGDLNPYDVSFTGTEQTVVKELMKAFQGKDADAINAINGGLASMSGRSIKASSTENGLAFGMNFPRWISNPSYYTSKQHNTQADLHCLAQLVYETGARTIEITLNHRDPTLGAQLAREAYAQAQIAGFDPIDGSEEGKTKPQAITITLNGKPMSLEDLSSITVGQGVARSERKIGSNIGASTAQRVKRRREELQGDTNIEKQKKLKNDLKEIKAKDPTLRDLNEKLGKENDPPNPSPPIVT